jgi:hypothetical protein
MRLCDYVLAADAKVDLADQKAARDWLTAQRWWPKEATGPDGVDAPYTDLFADQTVLREWERNVICLRSLSHRLTGKRPRRPYYEHPTTHITADNVLNGFLEMMRWGAVQLPGGPRAPDYLTQKTFGGLLPQPTRGGTPVPLHAANFFDLAVFWQCVFYSLVSDAPPNVCAQCGCELKAQTDTGRRSRRTLCKRCTWQKWRRKQPKKKMRDKWKAEKREARAEAARQDAEAMADFRERGLR